MNIPCRFSFVAVFAAKADQQGNLKYGAQLLIPKDSPDTPALLSQINAEVQKAIQRGVEKGKITAQLAKSSKFKSPVRDGDEYYAEEPKAEREACSGHFFLNSSNTNPVGVVDRFGRPITDQVDFYSGCYGLANVTFYAYNKNGNAGVGCGLQNVMKKRDGDHLDSRVDAATAFKDYVENPEEASNGDLE